MSSNNASKKLIASIVTLILLSACLCITTFALVLSMISVDGNTFATGSVKINLNDGKPVIEEREFEFEPGATIQKDFFIENQSTCNVYYKIYFANVDGGLADVLEITIYDGDEILCQGTARELTRRNVSVAGNALGLQEKHILTVSFHYPKDSANSTQNQILTFDLCADAVQTKNNPDRLFD